MLRLSFKLTAQSWDKMGIDIKDKSSLKIAPMSKTFRQIIDLWGQPQVLADEIGASRWAVRKWHQRDTIPSEWWLSVVRAADLRALPVTIEMMATISAARLDAPAPQEAAE